MSRFYRIRPGSSGSLMCPPGHPRHSWSLWEYESPRHRTEIGIGAIDNALTDEADASPALRARVQRMMDEAQLVPSELWIKQVYGYFQYCYAPEDMDRNVSRSIIHNPAEIAAGAARKALADEYGKPDGMTAVLEDRNDYRDGSRKPMRAARRGFEVTAKGDGSEVFVYTLADDGTQYGKLPTLNVHASVLDEAGFTDVRIERPQDRGGAFIPERVRATNPVKIERITPERHLAVLCVREYFSDHEPRLDLIDDPGKGYGSYPCTKCGATVQYEAKFDKLAKITTRIIPDEGTKWTYETECPEGGGHTTD